MNNPIYSTSSTGQALISYFHLLNQESQNITQISQDTQVQDELQSLFKRAYPFPLETIPPLKRKKLLRGITRSRWTYITSQIKARNARVNILDAGCGWGIYAIFFSLLGANAIGVDLKEMRLRVANARLDYYEKHQNLKERTTFLLKNVLTLPYKNHFDFIFASEAVSHISPAKKFLSRCFDMLKPGGQLVIADPNALYLPTQIKLLRKRGLNLYKTYNDPDTGYSIEYADERIFTIFGIAKMLKTTGFQIVHRHGAIGFHQKANHFLYSKYILPLEHMPIISDIFSTYYVIAGRK